VLRIDTDSLSRRRVPRVTDAAARDLSSNVRREVAEKFYTLLQSRRVRILSGIKSQWRRALSTNVQVRSGGVKYGTCYLSLANCFLWYRITLPFYISFRRFGRYYNAEIIIINNDLLLAIIWNLNLNLLLAVIKILLFITFNFLNKQLTKNILRYLKIYKDKIKNIFCKYELHCKKKGAKKRVTYWISFASYENLMFRYCLIFFKFLKKFILYFRRDQDEKNNAEYLKIC